MNNKIINILIVIPISLLICFVILKAILKYNNTNIRDFTSGDILLNSDFKNEFENWRYGDGIFLTNINNKIYVHTIGINEKQTRFWQGIEVVSGMVYCLKFNLKGKQNGAFAICRDIQSGNEKYLWCNGDNGIEKSYSWDIVPSFTGKQSIYLSTNKEGDYYFSDIKLYSNLKRDFYKTTILILILLISSIILAFIVYNLNSNFVFALTTLILLIVPVLKINKEAISENENRSLARYRPLFLNGRINTLYGKELNDYLNDRFFTRKFLIAQFRDMNFFVDRRFESNSAIQGKDGWLFEKFNPNSFMLVNNCDKLILTNIYKLNNQCQNFGIKVYYASIPEKNSVYREYNYLISPDEKLSKVLKGTNEINFIFLLDEFINEKNNGYLYFKDDHHFTERGASIYSTKLIDYCVKDFPSLNNLNIEDFMVSKIKNTYNVSIRFNPFEERKDFVGSIRNLLNLDYNSYNYVSYYESYRHKEISIPETESSNSSPFYSIYRNNEVKNKFKIMVLGDSNIAFMVPFITSVFSESLFIQVNERGNFGWYFKPYFKILENFKPDIIFLIVRSSNLQRWTKLTDF